ncbi:MAG: hypothetical protein IPK12_19845 [Gemmatimonadetes bacterium]|nr:hypothetical protein [Gemmatimonadota bacterium]
MTFSEQSMVGVATTSPVAVSIRAMATQLLGAESRMTSVPGLVAVKVTTTVPPESTVGRWSVTARARGGAAGAALWQAAASRRPATRPIIRRMGTWGVGDGAGAAAPAARQLPVRRRAI